MIAGLTHARAALYVGLGISIAVLSAGGGMRTARNGRGIRLTEPPQFQSPLLFEANHGQLEARLGFIARRESMTVSLARSGSEFAVSSLEAGRPGAVAAGPRNVRVQFVGGSRTAVAEPLLESSERISYFTGPDPSKWVTGVKSYHRVRVNDVYPGTDVVYYSHPHGLEYDVVLSPSADPNAVQLAFPDATSVRLASDGQLIASTPGGELRQSVPTVYQEIDGRRRIVRAHYKLLGGGKAGFALAQYDRSRPLVIDPVLVLQQTAVSTLARQALVGFTPSVFLDTADPDATAIAVDNAGCTYVAGSTDSTTGAGMDAYVTKWDATRTQRLYTAILAGSGSERAHGLAVDASGSAYVVGVTNSPNFPTAAAIQAALGVDEDNVPSADAFVAKIAPTGQTLTYSTFLGGSDDDDGMGIAIDAAGGAYVTGNTRSTNFPTAAPLQPALTLDSDGDPTRDAWVAKIAPAGSSLAYSTYLGGSDEELAAGIDIDSSGAAYLIGSTVSTNFPCASPLQSALALDVNGEPNFDLFITKVNPAGTALSYSTYLGGNGGENGAGIAVDASGCPVVVGSTIATNFPTQAPIQPALGLTAGGSPTNDAFITKLSATGTALLYSTYLGGSGTDSAEAVELDAQGRPTVAGFTYSNNFPTADPTQAALSSPGETSGFASQLSADGSGLLFSTYLGGTGRTYARALALETAGGILVAGDSNLSAFTTALPDEEPEATFAAALQGSRAFILLDDRELLKPTSTTDWASKHLGVIVLVDDAGTAMYNPATTRETIIQRCTAVRNKIGSSVPLFFTFWCTNNYDNPTIDPSISTLAPWGDQGRWNIILERVGWLAEAAVQVGAIGILMDSEDHIYGSHPNRVPPMGVTPMVWSAGGASRATEYVNKIRSIGPALMLGTYCPMNGTRFEGSREGFKEFWSVIYGKGRSVFIPEDLYIGTRQKPADLMDFIWNRIRVGPENLSNMILLGHQLERAMVNAPNPGNPRIEKPWLSSAAVRSRIKPLLQSKPRTTHMRQMSAGAFLFFEPENNPDWFSTHPFQNVPTNQNKRVTDALIGLLPWPQTPF